MKRRRILQAGALGLPIVLSLGAFAAVCVVGADAAQAQMPLPIPKVSVSLDAAKGPGEVVGAVKIFLLLTVLSLAPAILITMTSFARIVVVLSFLRQALGTQQAPPNQILIGLSLFLSFFIMAPVWSEVHDEAVKPYLKKEITEEVAFERALVPLRRFMLKQTRESDVAMFVDLSKSQRPATANDVATTTLIPAFIMSELKTAFQMGFLLFVPFLVLDVVISSVLMAMGMMMLPPALISLPFKVLLFVVVDGWSLMVGSLVRSFS
jgi:flagellar biosynthetic protein FliP